jgi:hypothetical protein
MSPTGLWAASTHHRGRRTDHQLALNPDGSFHWTRTSVDRDPLHAQGSWRHDLAQDLLIFEPRGPHGRPSECWRIHAVTEYEDSNLILVLSWLAIATPNLPILFARAAPSAV